MVLGFKRLKAKIKSLYCMLDDFNENPIDFVVCPSVCLYIISVLNVLHLLIFIFTKL